MNWKKLVKGNCVQNSSIFSRGISVLWKLHSEKCPHQIGSFLLCIGGSFSFYESCSFWLNWHQQSYFSEFLTLTASLVFLHVSHPLGRQHMLPFSTLYVSRLQTFCRQYKDLTHLDREFTTCSVPPWLWSWPLSPSSILLWEVYKFLGNTGAFEVPQGDWATGMCLRRNNSKFLLLESSHIWS